MTAEPSHNIASPSELREHVHQVVAARDIDAPGRLVCFGPQVVRIVVHADQEADALLRALRQAPKAVEPAPILTVHLVDGQVCGVPRPRLAWTAADFGLKRRVPGWSDDELEVFLLRSERGFGVVDWRRAVALVWIPSTDALPEWELAAPFRWLFDGLALRYGLLNLHAAVVGRPDAGVLIAGPGGSGKSTLALSCLAAGLGCAGDDYCLVERRGGLRVHSLYSAAKWRAGAPVRPSAVDELADSATVHRGEKTIVFLGEAAPDRLLETTVVRAIILPELGRGADVRVTGAPAHLAFRGLAPSTLAQSEADATQLAQGIANLARRVPAFRVVMPPDPGVAAACLAELIDELDGRRVAAP